MLEASKQFYYFYDIIKCQYINAQIAKNLHLSTSFPVRLLPTLFFPLFGVSRASQQIKLRQIHHSENAKSITP